VEDGQGQGHIGGFGLGDYYTQESYGKKGRKKVRGNSFRKDYLNIINLLGQEKVEKTPEENGTNVNRTRRNEGLSGINNFESEKYLY
jgi:hypothetical protein